MNRLLLVFDLRSSTLSFLFSMSAAKPVCGLRQVTRRRQASVVLAAGLSLSLLTVRAVKAQGQAAQSAAARQHTTNSNAGNKNAANGSSNSGAAQHNMPATSKPSSIVPASTKPAPAKPAPAAAPAATSAANTPAVSSPAVPVASAANHAPNVTGAARANSIPPQNAAQASHASAPVPASVSISPAPAKPVPGANVSPPQPAPTSSAAAAAIAVPIPATKMSPDDPLAQTKPDIFTPADVNSLPPGSLKTDDHTQSNAFAPVAGAWKMLAYLLPMLLVIVGCLQLLKRFQMKMGRLPGGLGAASALNQNMNTNRGSRWNATPATPASKGLLSTLLAGMAVNKMRQTPGSSIRLLESAPVGGASVHLLEVRGRVLLLGGSATGLTLLTEFEERSNPASNDFRDLLSQAAADMDAIDYEQPDMPATATVSALEDLMRETNQAVSRRARRFHTVQEAEDLDE